MVDARRATPEDATELVRLRGPMRLLDRFRERGVRGVGLRASEAGWPLYRSLGFRKATELGRGGRPYRRTPLVDSAIDNGQ